MSPTTSSTSSCAPSPALTYPLVDPSYTPDGAAGMLTQEPTPAAGRYQATFPYLGTPHDGFTTPS